MKRKIRMGMIGGGYDSFIGAVHRIAANLDGQIELVCGCFSSSPENSKNSGRNLYLPDNRIYTTYQEMIEVEAKLPESERMDFVSIVTPNHLHFEPALLALENGFHVVLDKPMTFTLDEAHKLEEKVKETGLLFALTHTYTGYPMIKEARERVLRGDLGKIRRVYVQYSQGWLADDVADSNKQASWRVDPKRSGKAGCMGDIGTHAFNLAEYITGLEVAELSAELNTFVPNRLLDDDGVVLIRYKDGARGMLSATQIAVGEENNLKIQVYGEKGGLEWCQEDPNTMIMKWGDKPKEIIRTSNGYMSPVAQYHSRTPGGHPEGYIEAFANIYRNFAQSLQSILEGKQPTAENKNFPTVKDGVKGMQFIETVVASSAANAKWLEIIK
ncbi:Gfo/Idh/MocA family oxidoreductase [Dysgonomonas sp. Marseille-P4677]|uniref:Gfo/Idh/MocA family protein n=1 Tax=Dysgonomonas sp. Marseille-P4677 TaxID=2364790 RepID=UPI001913A719|nr:Gfo/Idh/MocA family oxidoreductase [Dysgonomonas sp. Marseille-P4677]MBK5720663.1 Gfo/Idh/MocA family oxidoreductase [Dysgonomonas sp. Marseille-P4677]